MGLNPACHSALGAHSGPVSTQSHLQWQEPRVGHLAGALVPQLPFLPSGGVSRVFRMAGSEPSQAPSSALKW